MTQHQLHLLGGNDEEIAVLTETQDGYTCRLTCEYRGKCVLGEADDFFEALCQVRLQLEADGLIPYCYGASLNVYPSRMARDMALGKMAYKMQIGKQATKQDLVDIFASGPDIVPASVAHQQEYFNEWIATPRV